jgi:hypothetical protein
VQIVKGSDPIEVRHPIFLIFGQPGIGKTSLGFSMADPLLLDFDHGVHRAVNRRDAGRIEAWADAEEVTDSAAVLAPYTSVVVDTVGRALDQLGTDIGRKEPKKMQGGNLTQQGWGTLKNRFRGWSTHLRNQGKDVLFIAHDKEDKDGDLRIVRPDITGGSFGEVMKIADFVGYLYMAGTQRILDFNPTDRWIGKNPAGWEPKKLPPPHEAKDFMLELYAQGRAALGKIGEENAKVVDVLADWQKQIGGLKTPDECTKTRNDINTLPAVLASQVKRLLKDRVEVLGFAWDKKADKFVAKDAAA